MTSAAPGNIVEHSERVLDGRFRVGQLYPRSTRLLGHAHGYAPILMTLALGDGEDRTIQNFCLSRASGVVGRVLASSGEAAPMAELSIAYQEDTENLKRLACFVTGRVRADANGLFAMSGIIPGSPYLVRARTGSATGVSRPLIGSAGAVLDIGNIVVGEVR